MTLNEFLEKNNLTGRQFAALAGMTDASVSRIRNRVVRPSWTALHAISAATNGEVSPNDFLKEAASERG